MLNTQNSRQDILIRAAVSGEEAAIHEAHMRSIREICVKDHGEEEIRGWGNRPLGERWIDAIKIGYVWVVEYQDKIHGVGYLRIYDESLGERVAYIHALYLTPEVVGKGIGRKLATIMIDRAKKAKVRSVSLDSSITAHDFYKKCGFSDNGPMRKVEIGGYPVTSFPMKLNLNP